MAKHVVAAVGDIPPGTRKLAQVNGRSIVVFNLGGEFFALNNRCPHRGGSLFQGKQTGLVGWGGPANYSSSGRGATTLPPGPGWNFAPPTGKSWGAPALTPARRYAVQVEAGTRLVAGPYVAETVPVKVE